MTINKRGRGESGYWNPGEQSDFDKKFPSATGTYAMSLAQGGSINDVMYDLECEDGEDSEECLQIEQNLATMCDAQSWCISQRLARW